MRQLENLHRAIVTADATAANDDVLPHPRLTQAEQIGIYISAYRLRLVEAVTSDFPCLNDYLGAATMTTLASAYVEAVPPRSYNLDFYAFGFADFIHDKVPAPAASLATLESAIAETFMSPDSPTLTADILAQGDQTTLGERIFHARPAARLLHLAYDAETYWLSHKQGKDLPEIAPEPVYLCVCRDRRDVLRHRLESGAYALLQELFSGKNFDAAITAALEQNAISEAELAQNIGNWLPQWLANGFFRA